MDNQVVMSFQRKYLHIICLVVTFCTLLFSKIALADQYKLKLIVDLSGFEDHRTDDLWLAPLNNPTNDDEFFVAKNNGLIYLAGVAHIIKNDPILNLPLKVNNPTFISLTAMALHPSFLRPEQPGHATLYTAHVTEFDQEENANRLTLDNTNITFAFEAVITAWQYDFDEQKIDPLTQREIIRIPLKTQDSAIQQLTFDPYQKYWNADYGQLYFSLRYVNELKDHPLYSGVILRINPQMFGARNYTVSESNPFTKNPEINDEIVIMGGHKIDSFFWAKNNYASIFIQHNDDKQHRLSKAEVGDNLLIQSQSRFLWQQPTAMSSMLLYQGRSFLSLRNKMVFFSLVDKKWHLTSRALTPLSNESPILEGLIPKEPLSATSNLIIHQDNQGEILLFDDHKSRLYSLQSTGENVIEASVSQSNTTEVKSNYNVILIILVVALLSILVFIYLKKGIRKLAMRSLYKGYVRFEYEPIAHTILLFRNDNKKARKILTLDSIIRCEVLLNNTVIRILDDQPNNAISNQNETEIRKLFAKEHNDKMLDKQTRQIEIVLSDKDNSYTVCLYLRKGNNRVTDSTYYEVIDILIDLCWVISKHINSQATDTRLIFKVTSASTYVPSSSQETASQKASRQDKSDHSIDDPVASKTTVENSANQTTQQTEVVDALGKLVNLHQQGYLTDQEFSLAKAKLLQ